MVGHQPMILNETRLTEAAKALAAKDKELARVLADHGTPPLWARRPGFVTLIRIILEQQVSLASADAMYCRLIRSEIKLTPDGILAAGRGALRDIGVTRQKATYFINISRALKTGDLDLNELDHSDDEVVVEKLTQITGIGPWTAKIYLLMALLRPDVWPEGDVALATAAKNLKGLRNRPSQLELAEIAKAWQPHRATAARMLWHYYLKGMSNASAETV